MTTDSQSFGLYISQQTTHHYPGPDIEPWLAELADWRTLAKLWGELSELSEAI